MVDISIRGGLGNQVLEYLCAYFDHKQIENINVGVGSTHLDWVKKVWIDKVLVLDSKVNPVDNVNKYTLWKDKNNFREHCMKWPLTKLNKAIITLLDTEIKCKSDSKLAKIHCEKSIMFIANDAKRLFRS